jgi:hypothetical protein
MGLSLHKLTDRCHEVLIDGRLVGHFWRDEWCCGHLGVNYQWVFSAEEGKYLKHWELREISEMLSQMEGYLEDKS